MVSNIKLKETQGMTPKYQFPTKERNNQKIDGVIALIMALDRAIAYRDNKSIYETRSDEIEKLKAELSRLHDLPRGNEEEEKEIQAQMDELSKQIDELEENFITSYMGI